MAEEFDLENFTKGLEGLALQESQEEVDISDEPTIPEADTEIKEPEVEEPKDLAEVIPEREGLEFKKKDKRLKENKEDSPNFKTVREQREQARQDAERLKKDLEAKEKRLKELEEEREELSKYRDIVDLANSPELAKKYKLTREEIKSEAVTLTEAYGIESSIVDEIFGQENINDAREYIESYVNNKYINQDLTSLVNKFYSNKAQELKELEVLNPRQRLEQIRAEVAEREIKEEQRKQEDFKVAKNYIRRNLEIILDSNEGKQKLFKTLYSEDVLDALKDYEVDLTGELKKAAINLYENRIVQYSNNKIPLNANTLQSIALDSLDAAASTAVYPAVLRTISQQLKNARQELAKYKRFDDGSNTKESGYTGNDSSGTSDEGLLILQKAIEEGLGH